MSQVKLAAAKELIQEKRYEEARTLLMTINDPTATRWLEKLNKISPPRTPATSFNVAPPVSQEAEQFYTRQNRKARRKRIGNGLELILTGIAALYFGAINAQPTPSIEQGGKMVVNLGIAWIFFPLGVLAILGGIYLLRKRA